MFSQTRTALEQFDNQHDFERMSADILNALGHKDVVLIAPRGGSDGGRDITFTTESGGKGLACVTLRKDIDVKFQQDFSQRTAGEYDKYFLFCTAHLSAKQKLDFIGYCANTLQAEFVPMDIESLRSLLDSALKPIRESYLRIQDNITIRGKIKRILFDPQNEVEMPELWQAIALAAEPDAIGLFNLVKDQDLTLLSETQEELDALVSFTDIFLRLRRSTTAIDNYVSNAISTTMEGTYSPDWDKIHQYCIFRLFNWNKETAEKRTNRRIWYANIDFETCERVYESIKNNHELTALLEKFRRIYQEYIKSRASILALPGFKNAD